MELEVSLEEVEDLVEEELEAWGELLDVLERQLVELVVNLEEVEDLVEELVVWEEVLGV